MLYGVSGAWLMEEPPTMMWNTRYGAMGGYGGNGPGMMGGGGMMGGWGTRAGAAPDSPSPIRKRLSDS